METINSNTILNGILSSILTFCKAVQIENRINVLDAKILSKKKLTKEINKLLETDQNTDEFLEYLDKLIANFRNNDKIKWVLVTQLKEKYQGIINEKN